MPQMACCKNNYKDNKTTTTTPLPPPPPPKKKKKKKIHPPKTAPKPSLQKHKRQFKISANPHNSVMSYTQMTAIENMSERDFTCKYDEKTAKTEALTKSPSLVWQMEETIIFLSYLMYTGVWLIIGAPL